MKNIKIIKSHLDKISNSSSSTKGLMFKLKSKDLWDPLSPVYDSNKILSIYSKYISKYPNELMPFKPFIEESFGMDLHSILFTKTLLAIEYYILLCKKSQETNQLIINLLLTTSKFYGKTSNKNITKTINVNNIEELIAKIPNDFESLMYQKYQFQSYPPKSFVDLISDLGTIGQNALQQMNISYETPKTNENISKSNKSKDLKSMILQKFNMKIEQFEKGNNIELDENDLTQYVEQCCSCKTILNEDEEILCYQLFIYHSTIPLQYDTYDETIKYIKCFTLCTHLIHRKCLTNSKCPIDRYIRNNCIPKLDNKNDLSQQNIINAVEMFKQQFDDVNQIIYSFCSVIILYEVRLRSNSLSLEPKKFYVLARNLYLNLKVILNTFDIIQNEKFSVFQRFIIFLLKCNQNEINLNEIIQKYINEIKEEKEIVLFLRRVRLTEYYALGENNEELIDWKLELSNEELCKRYNIKYNGNEYTFEQFKFIYLPNNFLYFGKEPFYLYNELTSFNKEYMISLHDGITFGPNQIYDYYKDSKDDLHVIMNINFKNSRTLLVFNYRDQSSFLMYQIPSIYLDLLGNEGIGFKNEFELFLSEERLNMLIDDFLSGEILKYIY